MNTNDYLTLILVVVTALTSIATLVMAIVVFWTLREYKKLSYLQFYEIIARHHSEEITNLRREVRTNLASEVRRARKKEKYLAQVSPEFHLKVSTLANYYESLAMFLQGGWDVFPIEAKNTMMEMLHNSVSKHWPEIQEYADDIHPDRPSDWAQGFHWLYSVVTVYREERSLE